MGNKQSKKGHFGRSISFTTKITECKISPRFLKRDRSTKVKHKTMSARDFSRTPSLDSLQGEQLLSCLRRERSYSGKQNSSPREVLFSNQQTPKPIDNISLYHKFLNKLQEWNGKSEFSVIYSSDTKELLSRTINKSVEGKSDVMFLLLTSEGLIIGVTDSSKFYPTQLKVNNTDLVLFVFNKEMNYSIFQEKDITDILTLYPNDDHSNVLSVDDAFLLESTGDITLFDTISDKYFNVGPLVVPDFYLSGAKLKLERLVILEWK